MYEDFAADKAKEIMALASKGSSSSKNGCTVSTSAVDKSNNFTDPSNNNAPRGIQLHPQANGSGNHIFLPV